MRSVRIKTCGHFVEGGIMEELEKLVKDTPCDITDLELYVPTLKEAMGSRIPSIATFNIIARRIHVDVYYEKVLDILQKNGCTIIYSSIEE